MSKKEDFKPNHFIQGKVNKNTEFITIEMNKEFANRKAEKEWYDANIKDGKYYNRTLIMLVDEPVSEGSEKVILRSLLVM